MAKQVTMGASGKITLPRETIKLMGWRPGQPLRMVVRDGELSLDAFSRKTKTIKTR